MHVYILTHIPSGDKMSLLSACIPAAHTQPLALPDYASPLTLWASQLGTRHHYPHFPGPSSILGRGLGSRIWRQNSLCWWFPSVLPAGRVQWGKRATCVPQVGGNAQLGVCGYRYPRMHPILWMGRGLGHLAPFSDVRPQWITPAAVPPQPQPRTLAEE